MSSPNLFASILMASSLAFAFLGIAPVANAEGVGQSARTAKIAKNNSTAAKRRFKRRSRSVKIHLPLGPTSVYYDYPYYYYRGHYPTHIGGYVYYPYHTYRRYRASHFRPGFLRRQKPRGH